MKTTVYYFTGTGNSLKIARDIAEKLDGAELVPIARTGNSVQVTSESTGIVFPVYMFGLPLIVKDFIQKLDLPEPTYVFGVATHGGCPGAALVQMDKLLKKKGSRLSAGFTVRMPGNYIPLYGAIPVEKQVELFSRSEKTVERIVRTVRNREPARIEKSFFLVNILLSGIVYPLGSARIPVMDKKYWADDKCNSCGLCEKICPVNNIRLENGIPVWMHHCQQCVACLQWCPQEAIQYGKSTVGRKRYRHPDIKASDIIAQSE